MRAGIWRSCRAWWNWKSALASAIGRAPIFFVANLSAGLEAALWALATEFAYRVVGAGFYGALTEAFARSASRYASAAALVVLPTLGHSVEYLVHAWAGTPELGRSVGASVLVSVMTTTFSLAVMRHGLFLATSERPFLADVRGVFGLVRRGWTRLLRDRSRANVGLRSSAAQP